MKSSKQKIWFFTTTTALILSVLLLGTLLIVETSGGGLGKKRQETADEDDDFAEFDDDDFDQEEVGLGGRTKQSGAKEASPAAAGDSKTSTPPKLKENVQPPDFEEDEFEDSLEDKVKANEKANEASKATSQKESSKAGFDEDDETLVEDDDFVGIDDDEFDDDIPSETVTGGAKRRGDAAAPKLTITDVPMPMRGWQAYWAELLMLAGIGVYLLNYILGRYKNQNIAQTFFESNWSILEDNFYYLGEGLAANPDEEGTRTFSKQSDSLFHIWCSGRTCCDGMLLELKLLKRQDLVGILSNIFRPMRDVFRFTVEMSRDEMDSMVFAVATKKQAVKISKEYNDLINYCPEKKPGEKYGLSSQFVVMTEMGEVATAILDSKTTSVINKYASLIESIHFSDQFTGTKTTEPEMTKDGVMKSPEPKKLLIFTFALPINNSGTNLEHALEEIQPLFQFVFHTVERFKRIRLSKEGKVKADKNRAKVEEAFLKQTHAARAAALQEKKEEKRRQEKERILQEDDPEKQRRWEEKEQKREKKKKAPKMKQLKVKAM